MAAAFPGAKQELLVSPLHAKISGIEVTPREGSEIKSSAIPSLASQLLEESILDQIGGRLSGESTAR